MNGEGPDRAADLGTLFLIARPDRRLNPSDDGVVILLKIVCGSGPVVEWND